MHEIRFRGDWLGDFPSEAAARAHAAEHLAEHDPADVHIEPARPIHLFCNGALVSTFDRIDDARGYADALDARGTRRRPRAWLIVDTVAAAEAKAEADAKAKAKVEALERENAEAAARAAAEATPTEGEDHGEK